MTIKARMARRLRAFADKLDPPGVVEKRHHPAIKNPGELKDIEQAKPIAVGQEKLPRETRVYLPGKWGGPYL